ncbi:MAG: phosphoserine phosphatase, partial [Halobacteria archaeon]|nr:phosphoserine phosphatase [Halobacteria archaeon]
FVTVQKRLRELDKKEQSEKESKREEKKQQAKEEAKEVYEKFKEGETLDTEDFMLLQRAGLL